MDIMKTVIINNKKYLLEDNTPLKPTLSDIGYVFPCNGQGKCGKCRILCRNLAPTTLDKKFLSDAQIDEGIRLSCDKHVTDDLIIESFMQLSENNQPSKKLESCRIAVSIGSRYIDIGILDSDLVETVTMVNPLCEIGTITSIARAYKEDKTSLTNALRAVIGKNSVELFEKYSVAKAETTAIASNGFYLNILMGIDLDVSVDYDTITENDNLNLPTESVYILPVLNTYVGGDIFAELIDLKENSLLIECEEVLTFAAIGEENNYIASMWDIDLGTALSQKCFEAALDYMCYKLGSNPAIYIYGSYSEEIEEIIINKGLTFFPRAKTLENVAKSCVFYRLRTKLNKEKSRSSVVKLLEDDKFQEYLIN